MRGTEARVVRKEKPGIEPLLRVWEMATRVEERLIHVGLMRRTLAPRIRSSQYMRELMAILFAVKYWHHYLGDRHFVIKTDHHSLKYLLKQKLSKDSQFSWLIKLQPYDYEVQFKSGRTNTAADALSRASNTELMTMLFSSIDATLEKEIQDSWQKDDTLVQIIKEIQEDPQSHKYYTFHNQMLKRKSKIVVRNVPELQKRLLIAFHDSPQGGHSGMKVTQHRLCSLFFWPKMNKMIRNYVRICAVCQKHKPEHVRLPGLLQPLPQPTGAFTDLSMNFIEGLPKSRTFTVILVVVDRLTKFSHFLPLKHPYTAQSVAQLFVDRVIAIHGTPSTLVTDRDPVFLSRFWRDLFSLQGIELQRSSSYHPQTDGQTERVNQCMEQYLRCFCSAHPTSWIEFLPLAQYWYNSSYHESLKTSPYTALFGVDPPLSIPYVHNDSNDRAVDQMLTAREEALVRIRSNLQQARHKMKQNADKKRYDREFAVGDMVLLKLQPYRQLSIVHTTNQKLAPRYFGHYKVLDRIGNVAYRLDLPGDSLMHDVIHVSKLKKFHEALLPHTVPTMEPLEIVESQLRKHKGVADTYLLIRWNHPDAPQTWEWASNLKEAFPSSPLWARVFNGGFCHKNRD